MRRAKPVCRADAREPRRRAHVVRLHRVHAAERAGRRSRQSAAGRAQARGSLVGRQVQSVRCAHEAWVCARRASRRSRVAPARSPFAEQFPLMRICCAAAPVTAPSGRTYDVSQRLRDFTLQPRSGAYTFGDLVRGGTRALLDTLARAAAMSRATDARARARARTHRRPSSRSAAFATGTTTCSSAPKPGFASAACRCRRPCAA